MKGLLAVLLGCSALAQQAPVAKSLAEVKRIYVAPLTGGKTADAFRDLLIAGIDSEKLFILTDNPDRADAVLKGAAQEDTFTDTLDMNESINDRSNGGNYSGNSSRTSRSGGYLGAGASESESHHVRERKQQAYAAVRLCNSDGDVLWSSTQESLGAKFRGAGADVAQKIARQLAFDTQRQRASEAEAEAR